MSPEARVPGNTLLAGEYAVLEPGGLGITVAVERRVRLRARAAPELEILGSWGAELVRWRADSRAESPLLDAVVQAACGDSPAPPLLVEVDSSAFFASPLTKIGYGSSAAVAVGVAAALLRGTGEARPAASEVFSVALRAHRAFQAGRGSGYDVATSLHGGTGRFTGGPAPCWRATPLPWLRNAVLFRGARSVPTSGATARYQLWRAAEPARAAEFLEKSNAAVLALLAASSWPEARGAFLRVRDLGLRLGSALGVDAAIEPPDELCASLPGGVWKALGAGNEIGLYLPPPSAPLDSPARGALEQLVVARMGLEWQD